MRVAAPQSEAEWQAYFHLRWRTLRAPWGQPPGSERDELDGHDQSGSDAAPDGASRARPAGPGALTSAPLAERSPNPAAVDPAVEHLMLYDEQATGQAGPGGRTPLAVARLQLNDPQTAQLRYMAVRPELQGRGLGRLLLQAAEECARARGARRMLLQAREGALAFYQRCGYRLGPKTHLLFGAIQHWRMDKDL